MWENATKADILQHEKEAAIRAKETSDKEQKLRHELRDQVHEDYLKIDEKVWNNDKELALLKQSHKTMSENIKEIKDDMKEWFLSIEHKMEEFLLSIKDWYATKSDHQENQKLINWIINVLWTFWIAIILWWGSFIANYLLTK